MHTWILYVIMFCPFIFIANSQIAYIISVSIKATWYALYAYYGLQLYRKKDSENKWYYSANYGTLK